MRIDVGCKPSSCILRYGPVSAQARGVLGDLGSCSIVALDIFRTAKRLRVGDYAARLCAVRCFRRSLGALDLTFLVFHRIVSVRLYVKKSFYDLGLACHGGLNLPGLWCFRQLRDR